MLLFVIKNGEKETKITEDKKKNYVYGVEKPTFTM